MVPARSTAKQATWRGRLLIVAVVSLGLLLAACGGGGTTETPLPDPTATAAGPAATSTPDSTPPPTETPAAISPTASPSPDASPSPADERQVNVYFMRGEKIATAHRQVPASPRPATEAVLALLAGPTEAE